MIQSSSYQSRNSPGPSLFSVHACSNELEALGLALLVSTRSSRFDPPIKVNLSPLYIHLFMTLVPWKTWRDIRVTSNICLHSLSTCGPEKYKPGTFSLVRLASHSSGILFLYYTSNHEGRRSYVESLIRDREARTTPAILLEYTDLLIPFVCSILPIGLASFHRNELSVIYIKSKKR